MTMPNRIYRGPADRQPKTVSDKTVAGAYLPGTAVFASATALTQATSASGGQLLLLADRDFYSAGHFTATDPLLVAYASGDTGIAYVLEAGQEYQWAAAAATYTNGQELMVGASGRLTAATAGGIVCAYYIGATGAKSAGDLIDVRIAPFYTKA